MTRSFVAKEKSERLAHWLIVILTAVALIEAGWLLVRIGSPQNSLTLTPLYQALVGEEESSPDRSFELEQPGQVRRIINREVGLVGEPLTVEDLVRELSRLQKDGQLSQKEQTELAPLIAQAQKLREQLLTSQKNLDQLETEIRESALEIVGLLTPQQRELLIRQRDQVAVRGMEAPYWEALLQALETAKPPEEKP